MKTVTAKELKNRTGEVLRHVEKGERVLVTRRGKSFAVVSPVRGPSEEPFELRPYEEAWAEIEDTLRGTSPAERSWREAMRRSRRRA